jgi:hypothetical protein
MTASELRIGNWVKCKTNDGYKFGKICDILDIGYFAARCDGVEYRGKFGNIGIDIESVEPIELTDELLEKCGYLKSEDGYFYHKQHRFCDIAQCKDGDYYLYDGDNCLLSCRINGLHHLQNIVFALNDEELNIEL